MAWPRVRKSTQGTKLGPRVSSRQMKLILSTLESNPRLATVVGSSDAERRQMWDKLIPLLHAEGPAVKSDTVWKHFWHAKVWTAKGKLLKIKEWEEVSKLRSGHKLVDPPRLTLDERRILALVGGQQTRSERLQCNNINTDSCSESETAGYHEEVQSSPDVVILKTESCATRQCEATRYMDVAMLPDIELRRFSAACEHFSEMNGVIGSDSDNVTDTGNVTSNYTGDDEQEEGEADDQHSEMESKRWNDIRDDVVERVMSSQQECSGALMQLVEVQRSAVLAMENLTEAVRSQTELIRSALERIEKCLHPTNNFPTPPCSS